MRRAKLIVLLTSCVVVFGASFFGQPEGNPSWTYAEAVAANLSQPASGQSTTRLHVAEAQERGARAPWTDPVPTRLAPPERLAAAPEIVAASVPRSVLKARSRSHHRSLAIRPERCREGSCLEVRRPVAGPSRAVVTEAPDAPPAHAGAERVEFRLADRG